LVTEQVLAVVLDSESIFDYFHNEYEATFAIFADICRRAKDNPQKKALHPNRKVAGRSSLFPEGHGDYRLPQPEEDIPPDTLYENKETCPICGVTFKAVGVRESKLVRKATDADLREHYKGVEPMYYDIITCPQCLYSAASDVFAKAEPADQDGLLQELVSIKLELGIEFDSTRDAASVFAGYYLALMCAPRCFLNADLMTSKMWVKLSRLYQDCGDANMTEYANHRAFDAYDYVYQHMNLSPKAMQRLTFIMGDLQFKLGDYKKAKDLLFKAKIFKGGTEQIKRCSEDRLDEIKALEKAETAK
jgi:uncharacterized protein (DUF2225 family)